MLKTICLLTVLLFVSLSAAPGQTRRAKPRAKRPSVAVTTAMGLTYLVTQRGSGRLPKAGETVIVHYTGTLSDGVKFDSSHDRKEPFAFKLGAGQVIKGWDEGIAKLRVGDRAILVIPPQLGYGAKGAGGGVIPPDATLIFIVELVDVKTGTLSDELTTTLQTQGLEAMTARFRELQKNPRADIYANESDLNSWGYRLMRQGKMAEAIAVFRLNTEAYPNSANVYDSLAEAYLRNGDKQLARENYRKALELDPTSESARKALQNLGDN